MTTSTQDTIDELLGVVPGSRLDVLRRARPVTRNNAEASFQALFAPADFGGFSRSERFAVAAFVTALHGPGSVADFYAAQFAGEPEGAALAEVIAGEASLGATAGPYGHFPPGPLSVEDVAGPTFRVSEAGRAGLGTHLAAALEHAHLLVFHPRDASSAALQALIDAGWSTTGIVILSQLVAFLSFQIRVVAGLKVLAA